MRRRVRLYFVSERVAQLGIIKFAIKTKRRLAARVGQNTVEAVIDWAAALKAVHISEQDFI